MSLPSGLPPPPRSLQGLLQAGLDQWKETEKIHAMKLLIQEELECNGIGGADENTLPTMVNGDNGHTYQNSFRENPSARNGTTTGQHGPGSLDAALALLRKEMVSLRQLDMSLLCQLCRLNESIQEYKNMVLNDTHSESSSFSLDHGMDAISCIEEEPENEYENIDSLQYDKLHTRGHYHHQKSLLDEEESIYLEPVKCAIHSPYVVDKPLSMSCPAARPCTYESSC